MGIIREFWLFRTLRAFLDWFAASAWRYFPLVFLLFLSIRLYRLNTFFEFHEPNKAWELTSIAISLVETGEFANPYMIPTGPTAHLPPVYPMIYALIYKIFGLTPRASFVTMFFMVLMGATLYGMLPWFSDRLGFGKTAGLIGGLGATFWSSWAGHGEYLTGLAMGLLLVAFLQRWREARVNWGGSLLLGLAAGLAFHITPALLPVVLACMFFELWWRKEPRNGGRKWVLVGVVFLGIFLACLPWGWRNYKTFEAVFFIRSNFGLELRMGNHEGAAATMEVMDATQEHKHPRTHYLEAAKVRRNGEIEYMRQAQDEALAWIQANPGEFLSLSIQRFLNLWFGPLHRPADMLPVSVFTLLAILGAWRVFPKTTAPQRAATLIPLITYPLIYYIVAYMPRYRAPIDWLLFTLAGAAIWWLIGGE